MPNAHKKQWEFALNFLIQEMQKATFPQNHWIEYNLFEDFMGIIRSRGRIENCAMPESAKHPIYLHKNSKISVLITMDLHEKAQHAGVQITLASLRENYWIPQGRKFVSQVIRRCVKCRRYMTLPYALPPFPPLPESRVLEHRPLEFSVVDYFGPILIREGADKKKSGQHFLRAKLCGPYIWKLWLIVPPLAF